MNKKLLWGIIISVSVLIITLIGLLSFYYINLTPVGTGKEKYFKINSGSSTSAILKELKYESLIKSDLVAKIYMQLNKMDSIQAGDYMLNSNMDTVEILKIITHGDIVNDNITLTFKEGKRLPEYIEIICDTYECNKDEVIKELSDETYLNELINNYWFITDKILNKDIYYPLEGYLYPNTYEFKKDATPKEIITKMLNQLNKELEPIKNDIENNKYSFHELLTLASIVELEAANEEDRYNVAGVFYNRLNDGWTLGSDVTTYYAAKKTFKDNIGPYLDQCNSYNTRSSCLKGLPVGPIASPSITSIKASIYPSDNDYYFFVADKTKKVYFSKTSAEQGKVINDLKSRGLWLES